MESKPNKGRRQEDDRSEQQKKKQQEEKIDEQLEQTFPASDPPSYSRPGNDVEEE